MGLEDTPEGFPARRSTDERAMGELIAMVRIIQRDVDLIRLSTARSFERLDARLEHQDSRLGALERWRSYILGGIAVVGALVGALLSLLYSWRPR